MKRILFAASLLFVLSFGLAACKSQPAGPDTSTKPAIGLSANKLTFTATLGEADPAAQDLQIWNAGAGTLSYSISDDASWLEVAPTSGSSAGAAEKRGHAVKVALAGLAAGTHSATVTVTCAAASNSPQTVAVALNLSEKAPRIEVSPASLSFAASAGGSNPAAQDFQVWNTGGGKLSYSVSSDAAWLTAAPTAGESTGEKRTHAASASVSGLQPGHYTAALTISDAKAANNPVRITVSFDVASAAAPRIGTSAASLSFAGTAGGANPAPQILQVWNSGTGRLEYVISADAAWLAAAPSQGTSEGEKRDHEIAVNSGGLAEGTHSATLTVTDPKAANSPFSMPVTLVLTKAAKAKICATPASLSFTGPAGGAAPPPQEIEIWNCGDSGTTLNYSISVNAAWLSVLPPNGTSTGDKNKHMVVVSPGALGAGNHGAVITITDPNALASPFTVAVTLTLY